MTFIKRPKEDILYPQGFRVRSGDLLLASFTINILSLALPAMTLQVYDRILPNPGSGTLAVLTAGVCLAIVLETVIRLARAYVMGWAGSSFEHRLSCRAMNHMLAADLSVPFAHSLGENLNRLNAIGRLKEFYNGYSIVTLFELLFVPLFLGLIVYIAGPLAFMPAIILMSFTIVAMTLGKNLRQQLEARDEADEKRYNFLIESLEGIHTVKSLALENIFSRRYETMEDKSTRSNFEVTNTSSYIFNTGALFSNLMVAGVIISGAYFVMSGTITTGALIATILLSGRIMQPVQRALALWAKYQDYSLSRQKVESIFEMPTQTIIPHEGEAPERAGTISLDKISFHAAGSDRWILKDVSFDLKRGEYVNIEADYTPSLSALLDIMAGLYAGTSGTVTLDGRNIFQYKPDMLIGHIGYIRSEGTIFRGSIRDNMTCFGQIDAVQIQEIIALLQLDREISGLASGYDTQLYGNNTDTVPPGLKQKICMARVLAKKPRILIFDNADRSLDREGYNQIYNLLTRLKGKATIIVSSDDKNLTANADRHFYISGGELTQTNAPAVRKNSLLFEGMRA